MRRGHHQLGRTHPALPDIAAHLAAVDGLAPKTVDNYRLVLAGLLGWLLTTRGDVDLATLGTADLLDFMQAEADRGLSARSRDSEVPALKALGRYLVATGVRPDDPAQGLVNPRRHRTRVEIYSPEQADAVLTTAGQATDLRGRQRHALLATLRYTGIRAGELRTATLERLDLHARRLEVVGKGQRWRIVPLATPLAEILTAFLHQVRPQLHDDDHLFTVVPGMAGHPGPGLSPNQLLNDVRAAGQAAGVPGRHYAHRWRHTYATELLRNGVDVARVKRLMGHRHLSSTLIYVHLVDDDLRDALDQLYPG